MVQLLTHLFKIIDIAGYLFLNSIKFIQYASEWNK